MAEQVRTCGGILAALRAHADAHSIRVCGVPLLGWSLRPLARNHRGIDRCTLGMANTQR